MKPLKLMRMSAVMGAVALLAACSAASLNSGAQQVMVSKSPAPKSCKFKGMVTGAQGNFFTGPWTSNKRLTEGSTNRLRNEAQKIGANYVALLGSHASSSYANGSGGQVGVQLQGNAYACPPSAINE